MRPWWDSRVAPPSNNTFLKSPQREDLKYGFGLIYSHNGYICQFDSYTGRVGDTVEVGLGGSVVRRLMRDLLGKGYNIFMDSFFP